MKFRTFRNLVIGAILCSIFGAGWCIHRLADSGPAAAPIAATPARSQNFIPPAAPQPAPTPAAAALTTEQIRGMLEQWLSWNSDRGGKMFQKNILPQAPFVANAIRFADADAAKFSNDSRQWSQFKIDLDRNGTADEKWLLKNGHTYKREVLAPDGKTVVGAPQYFNN